MDYSTEHNKSLDRNEILESFIRMGFISEVVEKDNIVYAYTKENSEIWWNFAFLRRNFKENDLNSIQGFFDKRKRTPSIYISDEKNNKESKKMLENAGYKLAAIDSWMFWEKEAPKIEKEGILEVKSDEEFCVWINTFIESYSKDDPKNPYGEQREFAKFLKKRWDEGRTSKDKYFLAYKNKIPVAAGILSSNNKRGYLSCIGSIPSVRGRGFGKKITLYCIKESFKIGNNFHFLATEKGHFPFDFYERLGLQQKFTAYLYNKHL